jgi:alanyl aminopeptidase
MALCLAACEKPKTAVAPRRVAAEAVPLNQLPGDVIPRAYRLSFAVDPRRPTFEGKSEIDVTFEKPRRALYLHGLDLNVTAVSVRPKSRPKDTIPAHYMQVDKSGVARLVFVDEVPAGDATLVFDYDAKFGSSLAGLYKVTVGADSYAFTQFEPTSARLAFPSFDEPGFKTPFTVSVTAPAGLRVVSNTSVKSVQRAGRSLVKTNFATTKPLPTYLIAFAVGALDIVDAGVIPPNQYRTRPIPLRGVAARGNGAKLAYALSLTPKVVGALENYFQIPYPFEKLDVLAVPDFAAGAMENAGAITFRERLLLLDETSSLQQKRSALVVQAHELAHQWFGNLVTAKWWDDIWLNESFATWLSYKISAAVLPRQDYETENLRSGLDVMSMDELPAARTIHHPVASPDDILNAFDSITYDKGAAVLAMFENYLGEDALKRGIQAYLAKYSFGNATAADFIASVSQTTDHDELGAAFSTFLDQSGVPFLAVNPQCTTTPATAEITQKPYAPIGSPSPARLWKVPMCASTSEKTVCKLIEAEQDSLTLEGGCTRGVLPNAEGKGYYRFSMTPQGWASLISNAARLTPAGQIAVIKNVENSLRAGQATAKNLFDVITLLAPSARWDVIRVMSGTLHTIRKTLEEKDLPVYRTFVAKAFGPRLTALGLAARANETAGDTLARQELAVLLVSEARDQQVVAQLSKLAHTGVPRNWTRAALAPELRDEAMRAALIVDPAFADVLLQAYDRARDEIQRRSIVYAFAISEDSDALRKFLSLALTPKMRVGELRYLYQFLPEELISREELWSWYKKNYKPLLERVSARRMGAGVDILAAACDASSKGEMDAFFASRVSGLPGAAREYAIAGEQISRCAAFRDVKGKEISMALNSL